MEQKQKIFCQAEELFLKYGVKSVTMDDLARHLGVSKKTLYQHFENKSDLVEKTLSEHLEMEKKAVLEFRDNSKNAIEEIFKLGAYVSSHLNKMNPAIMFDLKRYYPKAWNKLEFYKTEFIYENVLSNIKRGCSEDLYRDDLQSEIIARFYLEMINVIMHPEFKASSKEIVAYYEEFLRYHVRGIASAKGLKVLEKINSKKI